MYTGKRLELGYDFIGDIHGEAGKLKGLLAALGYEESDGVYQHPERKAVFVGDYIDRGDSTIEVYRIVRAMVEAGTALAVMGNHEFNAVCYATLNAEGSDYLRTHRGEWGAKNLKQAKKSLEQISFGSDLHVEIIEWFKTLPLWIEDAEFRAVHACWYQPAIDHLRESGYVDGYVDDEFFHRASDEADSISAAVELILKSPEFSIERWGDFFDKDGHLRDSARLRWWLGGARTIRALADVPEGALMSNGQPLVLPDTPLDIGEDFTYDATERPVFFGHYWRTGDPLVSGVNAICVDYSAVRTGESLVAYRFDGMPLSESNFARYPGA